MNNVEFISYKTYPDDMYTKATCKVRFDRKYVVTYVQKSTKDGTGTFWTSPSASVTEHGEKKFVPGFQLDSQCESEMLIDFIKDNVKRINGGTVQMSASAFQQAQPAEVTDNDPLPF